MSNKSKRRWVRTKPSVILKFSEISANNNKVAKVLMRNIKEASASFFFFYILIICPKYFSPAVPLTAAVSVGHGQSAGLAQDTLWPL